MGFHAGLNHQRSEALCGRHGPQEDLLGKSLRTAAVKSQRRMRTNHINFVSLPQREHDAMLCCPMHNHQLSSTTLRHTGTLVKAS